MGRPILTFQQRSHLPLLLVALYLKSRLPGRAKVLEIIGAYYYNDNSSTVDKYNNFTYLNH
jgi:hypothetical protein